ncbi:MAG: dihydroorotase [Methanobacteriota archaeon]|nr:MAG: dihydroorotase [Euryarchaeota archaeon]
MRVVEGRALLRGRFEQCCIGIEDGKISSIKKIIKGDPHFDFGGNYILPAGIDIHVHFREPGPTHKEDFDTGTEAAACGGISCVFDMPNNLPATMDAQTFEEKRQLAAGKANVDFGLYLALQEDSRPKDLSDLRSPFKIFMAGKKGGLAFGDYGRLKDVLEETKNTQMHTSVHCEDQNLIAKNDGKSLEEYLRSRPNEAEASAIGILADAKAHICHVSARESLPLLENPNLTSEVTPHHLLLNEHVDLAGFGKTNPPLRRKADQMAMWEGLISGRIDIIASDHAPHTIEEKQEEFSRVPSGVPGVETSLPLMLMQVKKGNLNMGRLASAMMETPAMMMGLEKGSIEIGMDADLIAVDLRRITNIRADNLHSKCGWTPFEKWEAIFPLATFLRGELVSKDGDIQETGRGMMIQKREKP